MEKILEQLFLFLLNKIITAYFDAMEEQTSLIVSIITALLTGGIIILFLENQHIGANVIERYQFIMKPFMHRFSNYFKFLSSAKAFFSIKPGVNKDDAVYALRLYNLMEKLGHYAYLCIMSGRDYPTSYFPAKQLQDICIDINQIWYYWDNKHSYIIPYSDYDSNKANMFCSLGQDYLNEVFPHKYRNINFSLDLISEVSGNFYSNVFQPIQNLPFQYENWGKEERSFKIIILLAIGLCLMTLILILFLRYILPLLFFNIITLMTILFFVYSLIKFVKLESYAKKLFI